MLKTNTSSTSGVLLKNLTMKFFAKDGKGEILAVDHVFLEVKEGELLTLLGPSGCGKTTTLRMIAGFEIPTEGEIFIAGKKINDLPPNRRETVMVFQNYALFPHLNLWENVAYGLKVERISAKELKERVHRILELVDLQGLEKRAPTELSGGQQQRVALARALVKEPKVLLLDEPLSNLDANLRAYMRGEIKRIQQSLAITTIYVTHDQVEAMSLSDRIAIMNTGRIEQIGTPQAIYERPQSKFVAEFMGKVNLLQGEIIEISASDVTVNILGVKIEVPHQEKKFEIGQPVLVVLRPEAIELCSPQQGLLSGVVRNCVYLGFSVEYEIEIEGTMIHVADYDPRRRGIYEVGDRVGVNPIKGCLHLLST